MTGAYEGTTVFVTGGAHGIGFETARMFVADGASAFLLDRDGEQLGEALEKLGSACGMQGDVCSRADVEMALVECERRLGPVDVLVNNAGYSRSKHVLEQCNEDWDEIVSVCLTGAFRAAQTVARAMARQQRGGLILNACATSAIASEPGQAAYAAAKAGVLALTRAMAHDLAHYRIRVLAVLPGEIETHRWPNVELQRIYESRIAARRSGRPSEAAAAYLYLASEAARQLTGAALVADGGMLAWE